MYKINHFIAGKNTAAGARKAPVFNPATGEHIADVALADAEVVEAAIAAAKQAAAAWQATTPLNRARIFPLSVQPVAFITNIRFSSTDRSGNSWKS